MLGISATALKKACRRLGVQRWPYTLQHRLGVLAQAGGVAHALPVPHTGGLAHRPKNTGSAVSSPNPWLDYSYVRKIQRKHCASRSHRKQLTSGLSGEKTELLGEDTDANFTATEGAGSAGHPDLEASTSTSTSADFTACHTATEGAYSAGKALEHSKLEAPASACECSTGTSTVATLVLF